MLRHLRGNWGYYWVFGGIGLVLIGSMYVHQMDDEDKLVWLAVVTDTVIEGLRDILGYSLPDCDDSDVLADVEEWASDTLLNAVPYHIEQRYDLADLELVVVMEKETIEEEWICRGHLGAPHRQSGQLYRVGLVRWTIQDEPTKAGWYAVEARLESMSVNRWVH